MSTLGETLSGLGRSLVERPDALMQEIGAGGELLIARLRVAATVLLLLLPIINHLAGGRWFETVVGLSGAVIALAIALLWLYLAKRARRHRWLPFVTGASDITLTSLVLVLLAMSHPAAALNSQVVFAVYVLAIVLSALKNDGRASLFIGLTAALQYLTVVVGLMIANEGFASLSPSPIYGSVDVPGQIQRVAVLLIATLITAVIVFRMQRLVMLSGTDTLTGLPNRSYLIHRVPQILADARRDDLTMTLALLDLDHFRRINDEFGHGVGDRALQHVVHCLRDAIGREQPLIRVGGEEFVLLMHLPLGTAWELMERLRQRLANTPFSPKRGSLPVSVTISAGLASFPHDAAELSGLMRRADLRLREAKRMGRNRLVARG